MTSIHAVDSRILNVQLADLLGTGPGAIRIGPFGSALKKNEYSDSGIRVLGIEDVLSRGQPRQPQFIPMAKYRELARYSVTSGDVLVTNMGTVGRAWLVPPGFERAIISSHLIKITVDSSLVDPRYVEWAINVAPAVTAQVAASARGAIMAGFNTTRLKELRIPMVSPPEQARIVDILDRIQGLRRMRREVLLGLQSLSESVFAEMFDVDALSTQPFREIVSGFRYGSSVKSAADGYPALRIPNVGDGSLDLTDLKLVPVSTSEFNRLRLVDGDLLFVRTNGNPDFVGRCAMFDSRVVAATRHPSDKFVYASYLIRARIGEDLDLALFVQQFMRSPRGKRLLRSHCKTSAGQFNLNTEGLGAIPVPIASPAKRHQFAVRFRAIERMYAQSATSLAGLDELFNALRSQAFDGSLPVS